jgi:hypothetical protein
MHKSKKVSKTVLLDVKTIELLKEFSRINLGSESMSGAIRAMARQWEQSNKISNKANINQE